MGRSGQELVVTVATVVVTVVLAVLVMVLAPAVRTGRRWSSRAS
jgi:hypothetical protein